ncbi:MAG: DUF4271 domain-containing protein [Flavobacteriales bacterium]|nr:hypothetical protein [Flavobacteriales bacterium]MCC6578180.1 DUF4271 domain-containing protein [Flavobacteriales bacterium]NUQ14682.1 DUF4271 domain-containing protein [Flavobacteriales bacterium]
MGEPRTIDPLSPDWVVVLLLVVVALLAWTNVASPRKWGLVLEGAFRTRVSRRSLREDIDLQARSMLGLLLALLAGMALFVQQALVMRGTLGAGPGAYALVMAALVLLLVLQVLLLRALAWFFQGDGGLQEYAYALVLNHLVLGAVLLPLAVLVAYRPALRPALLSTGAVLAVLIVVLRWGRAVFIGRSSGMPFRHIFLYLCAAEILPVLLALRTLQHHGPPAFHLP